MLKVSAQQTLLEIVRLILESGAQEVFCPEAEPEQAIMSSEYLINIFVSGFASNLSLQDIYTLKNQLVGNNPEIGQNALYYSMRWFISTFDSLHDGVLIADQDEIVRYINHSFERISGAKFAKIIGRVLAEARPGARLGEVIRSGQPMYGVRRKLGEIEYITDMHPLIFNGKCVGGVTIARDITEIQQLQTKLSKYRARYNDLLRQIHKEHIGIYKFSDIKGSSPLMTASKQLAEKLAASQLPILIRGESGTGKELFAHAIHLASHRRENPFVTVNCAAIPGPLLESELFGYEEGAFSGAKQGGKTGLITLADRGTLFLDEIGDMDIELQAKMLRVLQTGEVQPVGSLNKIKVDLRIIAATNRDLDKMIPNGKFREDLFYRLNVAQISVPPLRERMEDIPVLAEHFLSSFLHPTLGKLTLAPQTLQILEHYPWPGNIRELENTIRFIANIAEKSIITPAYLPQVFFQTRASEEPPQANISNDSLMQARSIKEIRQQTERDSILAALDRFGRSVEGKKEAAKELGISLTTLYTKMNYYHIR